MLVLASHIKKKQSVNSKNADTTFNGVCIVHRKEQTEIFGCGKK